MLDSHDMDVKVRRFVTGLVATAIAAIGLTTPAMAVTCNPGTALPWMDTPGWSVLRDNLETGDYRRWTRVVREGDAVASVTTSRRYSGWCSGRVAATSRWDSRASVQKHLGSDIQEVWATGRFYIAREGSWGSNVPIWRFFNGGQRVVDVHRQNVSGDLWLRRYDGSGNWRYTRLGPRLSLNRWYSVKVYVRSTWSGSKVAVWVDGNVVYYNYPYLHAGRITTAMIGSEHQRQVMDVSFDEVVVEVR